MNSPPLHTTHPHKLGLFIFTLLVSGPLTDWG